MGIKELQQAVNSIEELTLGRITIETIIICLRNYQAYLKAEQCLLVESGAASDDIAGQNKRLVYCEAAMDAIESELQDAVERQNDGSKK